ncbi:MAG: hypothetical protein AAB408_03915, partial [Patescibacteria group bacterium]
MPKARTKKSKAARKTLFRRAAAIAARGKRVLRRAPKNAGKKNAFVKPSKKQKLVVPEAPVTPPADFTIWNLVEKGRGRGFLTETEVLSFFPRVEQYLSTYEGFLDLLDKNGLTLVEAKEGLLGQPKERAAILLGIQGSQPDMEGGFDLGSISQDSIQMYLREIG